MGGHAVQDTGRRGAATLDLTWHAFRGVLGCGSAWTRLCPSSARHPLTTPLLALACGLCSYEGRWVREYVDATVPEMAFGEYWDTCSYSGELPEAGILLHSWQRHVHTSAFCRHACQLRHTTCQGAAMCVQLVCRPTARTRTHCHCSTCCCSLVQASRSLPRSILARRWCAGLQPGRAPPAHGGLVRRHRRHRGRL